MSKPGKPKTGSGGVAISRRFQVEVEGMRIGTFAEVTLPVAEVTAIEYNYGESKNPNKRPGHVKLSNLVLRRGDDRGGVLRAWYEAVQTGKPDRRSMGLAELDEQGLETQRWRAFRCWPTKWVSPVKIDADGIAVEEIEIVCEELTRAA